MGRGDPDDNIRLQRLLAALDHASPTVAGKTAFMDGRDALALIFGVVVPVAIAFAVFYSLFAD